jgi:gliding motility-associated-like protein
MFVVSAQSSCDSLLVAFYDFQGNLHDQSGNGFDGFALGNAVVTDRLEIIGNTNAVLLPTHILQGAQNFSVSCRVRFDHFQTTGDAPINVIINGYSDNNAFVLGYRKLANIIHLTFDGIGTDLPLPFELQEETWYCLVFVRNGGLGSIYMDGISTGVSLPIGPNPVSLDVLLLGQDQDCPAGCFADNQSLAGQLDNLRIFQRVLSAEDALALCGTTVQSASICEGEVLAGHLQSGQFISYSNLIDEACETMHLLDLTVHPVKDTTVSITLCNNELFNGMGEQVTYKLTLQTTNGCDSIVHLRLQKSSLPYFPTAFSPNGDGINDYFGAMGEDGDFIIATFKIFDRWGSLCYEGIDLPSGTGSQYGWDGTLKGKPCVIGVYTWTAVVEFSCGRSLVFGGEITLAR